MLLDPPTCEAVFSLGDFLHVIETLQGAGVGRGGGGGEAESAGLDSGCLGWEPRSTTYRFGDLR